MRVFCWANDMGPADLLLQSARMFGITVEPIGLGRRYRNGISKVSWLHDAVKGFPADELILCTDAYDCIYLRPLDGIEEVYSRFNAPIVYAAERWYRHGEERLGALYAARCDGQSIYCYPNGGAFLGRAGAVQAACRWILDETRRFPEVPWEQWFLGRYAAQEDVALDYQCHLFWVGSGEWKRTRRLADLRDGRIVNKRTGQAPYVLHSPIANRSRPILTDILERLEAI